VLNVLCGVHRVVGKDELGALPVVGVRDFDGGGLFGEVGEDEQLGGAVVTGERVDLLVVCEQMWKSPCATAGSVWRSSISRR
jgi:hypothetical protein